MKQVTTQTIDELNELSRLLGEFGQIKRAVKLPNGDLEPDSHHSFSLALIAYEMAKQYAPELDANKILLYGLVHDLTELVTGDVRTFMATPEELEAKAINDQAAVKEVSARLHSAPHIVSALHDFEAMESDEALFVYWLDKMVTIPTHFYDKGENLHALGAITQQDIKHWYDKTLTKLNKKSGQPHSSAVMILELAYQKMHDELMADSKVVP